MTDRTFLNDVALFGQIWLESECNYAEMSRVTGVPRTTISEAARRLQIAVPELKSRKETVAFINDTHSWHVDPIVWPQVLSWLEYLKPDRLVHLGDAVDNPSVSKFSPRTITVPSLNTERTVVRNQLRQCREAIGPDAKFDFTPGNHEYRVWRWLMEKAPHAADMPEWSTENWLDAESIGMTVHGLDGFDITPWFRAYHGLATTKSGGISTAASAELRKWGKNGISGHCHYTSHAAMEIGGKICEWHSNGCLTNTESEYVTGPSHWTQAVAVAYLDHDDEDAIQVEQIKIRNRRLIWRGIDFSS